MAVTMTGGDVLLPGAPPELLQSALDVLIQAGAEITVVPLARVAAISATWVPDTVTLGKSISAPFRPPGALAIT